VGTGVGEGTGACAKAPDKEELEHRELKTRKRVERKFLLAAWLGAGVPVAPEGF